MFSLDFPYNQTSRVSKNYTVASTLRKPKSLVFELLFGDYCEKRIKTAEDPDIRDAIDYAFKPGQVFGYSIKSLRGEFKKMHQCFVLKTCRPNEEGAVVPGINPGAEILLHTKGATDSIRFLYILGKLKDSKFKFDTLEPAIFKNIHLLIDAKLPTGYFITELFKNA